MSIRTCAYSLMFSVLTIQGVVAQSYDYDPERSAILLVDPYNENQIADKIDLLLKDKIFYEQHQKLSIKKASEYSWEKSTEKIIKLCEKL